VKTVGELFLVVHLGAPDKELVLAGSVTAPPVFQDFSAKELSIPVPTSVRAMVSA